jgi:hypothetical protein
LGGSASGFVRLEDDFGVDKELRMSMNPGAATDFGHWRRWAKRSDEDVD